MGKSRSDRRASSGELANLYATETTLGWRITNQVPMALGWEKVALRKWRAVQYDDGSFAGFQPTVAPQPGKSIPVLAGSPPTITLTEVQMNAGLFGRSRTMGMPEWKREKRHARYDEKKILAPEDAIERAIEKVKLWPYPASRIDDGGGEPVYGDRAIRVYPHTR